MSVDTAGLRTTILERLKQDAHRYSVTLHFTEDVLGTAPENPDIYTTYLASKVADDANVKELPSAEIAEKVADTAAEEVSMLPPDSGRGLTVFRRDPVTKHLIFLDYQLRGFLKEAGRAMGGITAIASSIDKWVFVDQRMTPILRDGKPLLAADDVFCRPLKAQTMMGPRVAIASSERIHPPASLSFTFFVLAQGVSKKEGLNFEQFQHWLDYGALSGLGQWRSGSHGRFVAELKKLK